MDFVKKLRDGYKRYAYVAKRRIPRGRTTSSGCIESDASDFGSQPRQMHGFRMSVACLSRRVAVMRV